MNAGDVAWPVMVKLERSGAKLLQVKLPFAPLLGCPCCTKV